MLVRITQFEFTIKKKAIIPANNNRKYNALCSSSIGIQRDS